VGRIAAVASTPLSLGLPLALRRLRPDIVHLHFPYPPGEISTLLATPRAPVVITYHSDVVRQRMLLRFYGPLLRRVLRHAARILVTSPSYARHSPWLAAVHDRTVLVPLGIDPAPFLKVEPRGDGHTLLFVGRFRYYKGLQYLLEALSLLPDTTLLLVGGGPQEPALRELAHRLGIEARVRWLGSVDDAELPGIYAGADVFVLPACERSEAFGLVLVEAATAGLPCVSTELGTGTSYVNLNGETGLVVPPADVPALAAACRRLLDDPALRRQYGAAGRARAVQLFDIKRVAREVAGIYRALHKAQA
jgi:rhamnosyl/mannosyltransferase